MSQHTPGPWFVGNYWNARVNSGSDYRGPNDVLAGECALCTDDRFGPPTDIIRSGFPFHEHQCREEVGDYHSITAENGLTIISRSPESWEEEEGGGVVGLANARLIAASPELLEACKAAFDAIYDTDEVFRYENAAVLEQLDAAITKAGAQ